MALDLVLRIRRRPEEPWIQNHHVGGWKVRNEQNTGWIDMNPANTQIANPDFDPNKVPDPETNPAWLNMKTLYELRQGT